MPNKITKAATEQFSITLSIQAIDMLEQLITTGLHGNSRAEVARALISDKLEDLLAKGVITRRTLPRQ